MSPRLFIFVSFFFFNDTATTEIYTLSLHDALPILEHTRLRRSAVLALGANGRPARQLNECSTDGGASGVPREPSLRDRKSTRLNSSHANISYAVFCLKKKKTIKTSTIEDRTRVKLI